MLNRRKSAFVSGEISRELYGRVDVAHYQNGAAELTNVMVDPQGGARRRPGTQAIGWLQGSVPIDFTSTQVNARQVSAANKSTHVFSHFYALSDPNFYGAPAGEANKLGVAYDVALAAVAGTGDQVLFTLTLIPGAADVLAATAYDVTFKPDTGRIDDGLDKDYFRWQYDQGGGTWVDFGPAFGAIDSQNIDRLTLNRTTHRTLHTAAVTQDQDTPGLPTVVNTTGMRLVFNGGGDATTFDIRVSEAMVESPSATPPVTQNGLRFKATNGDVFALAIFPVEEPGWYAEAPVPMVVGQIWKRGAATVIDKNGERTSIYSWALSGTFSLFAPIKDPPAGGTFFQTLTTAEVLEAVENASFAVALDTVFIAAGKLGLWRVSPDSDFVNWYSHPMRYRLAFGVDTPGGSASLQLAPMTRIDRSSFDVSTVDLTLSALSGEHILVTASAAIFTQEHLGQIIQLADLGRARIITAPSVGASATVRVSFEIPASSLTHTNSAGNQGWSLETGWRYSLSENRGGPTAVAFHQERLYVGGAADSPDLVAASAVGDVFSMLSIEALDDSPFQRLLGTGRIVRRLFGSDNLLAFTDADEHWLPTPADQAVTAVNANFNSASNRGIIRRTVPVSVGGQNLFLDGSGVRLFQFLDVTQRYENIDLSVLARHLINNPASCAAVKSGTPWRSDLLVIMNDPGGTVTAREFGVLASNPVEEFNALFRWSIGVPSTSSPAQGTLLPTDDDGLMLLMRGRPPSDVAEQVWLLEFNPAFEVDFGLHFDFSATLTDGSPWFANGALSINADEFVVQTTADANGDFTLTQNRDVVIAGAPFPEPPRVRTLPIGMVTGDGKILFRKLRVQSILSQWYRTRAATVEGQQIKSAGFGPASGGSPFSAPATLISGNTRLQGVLGWSDARQLTWEQPWPLAFHLLAAEINAEHS